MLNYFTIRMLLEPFVQWRFFFFERLMFDIVDPKNWSEARGGLGGGNGRDVQEKKTPDYLYVAAACEFGFSIQANNFIGRRHRGGVCATLMRINCNSVTGTY